MKTNLFRIVLRYMFLLILIIFTQNLSAQFNFYDVTGQPVLSYGDPNQWDDAVLWNPTVIKDGDTLRMWYTGHNETIWTATTVGKIGYAWSLDGISWNKYSGNPVLYATYGWEGQKLYGCAVIKEADTFKIWYGAQWWRSPTSYVVSPAKKIGYAWSLDGKNWNKHPEPVMELGPVGDWDDDLIVPYTVIKEENEYILWYWAGRYGFPVEEYSYPQGGLATSPDGIQWTKYNDPATMNAPYANSDPVLHVGSAFLNQWDSHRAFEPVVMKIDTEYLMFYTGLKAPINSSTLQQIGFATSTNGIDWLKSIHNPIIKDDGSFVEWGNGIYNGTVLFYDGIYHFWFACFHTPPNQAMPQIGYAETTSCPAGDVAFYFQENIDNFHIYYPSCTEIPGDVYISGNNITNLNGLSSLTSIAGDLEISGNPNLTSLTGLSNIISIEGSISIDSNDALTSLAGLDNIDTASIESLMIHNNNLLSECAVQSVCSYLINLNCIINIHDNALRCNDSLQIMNVCNGVVIDELLYHSMISLSPNPFTTSTTLSYTLDKPENVHFTIYNLQGQIVERMQVKQTKGPQKVQWNAEGLPAGLYIIRLQAGNDIAYSKLLLAR